MTIQVELAEGVDITNATARLKSETLKTEYRGRPFYVSLGVGLAVGYQRSTVTLNKAGVWKVRWSTGGGECRQVTIKCPGGKKPAVADDYEVANGTTVLSYAQALERARLYRDNDGKVEAADEAKAAAGAPGITVAQALGLYKANLLARKGSVGNATLPAYHLAAYRDATGINLLDKPLHETTVQDWRDWQAWVVEHQGIAGASINRMCRPFRTALNLGAKKDKRIVVGSWMEGLAKVQQQSGTAARHKTFKPSEICEIVRAAYRQNGAYGIYIDTHVLGQRTSQLAELDVEHFNDEDPNDPCLEVLSSRKGRNKERKRILVPVPAGLAARLREHIKGRRSNEPLLMNEAGGRWSSGHREHKEGWQQIMVELGFAKAGEKPAKGKGMTVYHLRHTAITEQVKAGIDLLSIANNFDTSVGIIKKHYAEKILNHTRHRIRAATVDIGELDNVVVLREAA